MPFDTIWTHAHLATMAPNRPGLGIVEDGCVAARDGRIVFAGAAAVLPGDARATETIDCGGRWITPRLVDCDLVATLEPCPMCAAALVHFRVRRVVFGAYDPKGGGVEHGPRVFEAPGCLHRPEVVGGVHEQECAALLREFFKGLRG